jgi:hypothetical protein
MQSRSSSIFVLVLICSNTFAQGQTAAPRSEPEAGVKAQAGVTAQVARIATYKAALGELDQEALPETDVRPGLERALRARGIDWLPVSHFLSSFSHDEPPPPFTSPWSPATYNPFTSFGRFTHNPMSWNSSPGFRLANPYQASSEIRLWEMERAIQLRPGYINRLPNADLPFNHPPNPWRGTLTSVTGRVTTRALGAIYSWDDSLLKLAPLPGNGLKPLPTTGGLYNELANLSRSQIASSYNRIADVYMKWGFSPTSQGNAFRLSPGGVYAPQSAMWIRTGDAYRTMASRIGPTDSPLLSAARGARIYTASSMTLGTAMQAGTTFVKTVDYVGKSMQVMNPPIYLQERVAGWGWKGAWFNAHNGHYYWETLKTAGPGPITRTHADLVATQTGTYYRYQEIRTPVTNVFERFVLNRYPVGSYWDPKTSTVNTTTIIRHRSGMESWNSSAYHSFPNLRWSGSYNSPLPTVKMPSRYADILRSGSWQIPSTPQVSPMPKIQTTTRW